MSVFNLDTTEPLPFEAGTPHLKAGVAGPKALGSRPSSDILSVPDEADFYFSRHALKFNFRRPRWCIRVDQIGGRVITTCG
jgi:hypothetical protein